MKPTYIGGKPFIDAEELYLWLMEEADKVHCKRNGMGRIMDGGRVDAFWTVAAELQDFIPDAVRARAAGAA
jgi:hypothetical protein